MKNFGSQSMVSPLRKVLIRRPDNAFLVADPKPWNYVSQPDLPQAQLEHDAFASTLVSQGVEVFYHRGTLPHHADSVFVFDPVLMTRDGAIVLKMGKELRRGEEGVISEQLRSLGVPIRGQLENGARAEGGDLLWLDEKTLVAGRGFRTNDEGIRQLRAILQEVGVKVLAFDLPVYKGAQACLHLLSLISLVKRNLAVVFLPLLPVAFFRELAKRDVRMLEISETEFETMGSNVLALSPGKCLILEDNSITRSLLEEEECEVITYRGNELSLKAEGGPTCLTLPLLRDLEPQPASCCF